MIISAEKYAKERDKMLLKRDINELRKFVNKNKKLYRKEYIKAFNAASDEIIEITMHKMIVHCINLPFNFRQESADWLIEKGFDLDIKIHRAGF